MYTAIVIDKVSQGKLFASLARTGGLPDWKKWDLRLHHCTLAFGGNPGFSVGQSRTLLATHIGFNSDAIAFKVEGAEDSLNTTPHVTALVSPTGKAKNANLITNWKEIAPIKIEGMVKICE